MKPNASFLPACLLLTSILAWSSFGAPPVPRSVHYDGTRDQVQTYEYDPAMNSSVAMTVEAWVYRENASRCETILSHDFRSSFWLGFCDRLRFYRSGGVAATSSQSVPANQWTHVAATYDGTRVRFYINGNAAGDSALANSGPGPANRLHLGGVPETDSGLFANGYYFQGYLDEVRLWGVARSQAQIRGNMFVELRQSETNVISGLTASFHLGGGTEAHRGWSSVSALAPARISGFGLLPSRLVIPRATAFNFDGSPNVNFEFAGAEQMVLRYNDGANARDNPVYLVYRNTGTDRYLYFGTKDLRPPVGISWGDSYLTIYVDPDGSRSVNRLPGDFSIWTSTDGGSGGGWVTQPFPNIQLFPQSATNWQYMVNFCVTEFVPPCQEIRIHSSHLNSFGNPIGLLLQHGPNRNSTDVATAPGNGDPLSPATYAEAIFGGPADSGLSSITVTGRVLNAMSGSGLSNHVLRLYSGSNTLSGTLVAQTTTSASGSYGFHSAPVISGAPITLALDWSSNFDYRGVEWASPAGQIPIATNSNWEVVYAPCNNCALRPILFNLAPPPEAMQIDGFSPTNGARTATVRATPARVHEGSVIRISGSHIHDRIEVYLSTCTVGPDFCTPGVNIFQMPIVAHDPARNFVDARIPELTAALPRLYNIWIKDNWTSHPGWRRWNYPEAGAGPLLVTDPPYPLLYGFEWANDGNGPTLEDFESSYGDNIFTYIPFPPFKVRDPYYFTFWLPLYFLLGDASQDGNCHGIAAVSRMFERGILNVADFDNGPSCGPAGVRYPNGFGGLWVDTPGGVRYRPCKPASWTGWDLFQAFRPRNLWAVVRQNMMAQFSEEGIQNILSQTAFDGGNPGAVLNRVRSDPAGYILCFKPSGSVNGHAVTPYAVQDGVRLTEDLLGTTPTNAANFSIIRIYDNNWENMERFMEVDRTRNHYRYLLGFRDGQPVVWEGRSLYTVPMSFFTSGRHAPGPWNLAMPDRLLRLIFAGGADVTHTNDSGEAWGWNAEGEFREKYAGAKSYFPWALGFYPDRELETGFAFFPETNLPTASVINVRGGSYMFQAAQNNLAVQLMASNAVPHTTDYARMSFSKETLAGFSFIPQAASSVTPMLAMPEEGGSTVFILVGLSLPAFHEVEVFSTALIDENGRQGIGLINRGDATLHYSMQVQSASSGAYHNKQFGPFAAPPGAASRLTFPQWPEAAFVRAETDLNHNGTIDLMEQMAADYLILAVRDGADVLLRWRSQTQDDLLEQSDSLSPPEWTDAPAAMGSDGPWKSVKVPAAGQASYYRVRSGGKD